MICYINKTRVSESYFWHAVQGLMGPYQMESLFNGAEIWVGGICYQMVEEKDEYKEPPTDSVG